MCTHVHTYHNYMYMTHAYSSYMCAQRLSLLKYIYTQTHPHAHTEANKHTSNTYMYVLTSITHTYTCLHTYPNIHICTHNI